jgi:hypothetical protein
MPYVVIRGCKEPVNEAAFGRWYEKETASDVTVVLKRLRKGLRHTLFLDEREGKQLLRLGSQWGLTGLSLHGDNDMSEYPPAPPFWMRWWYRIGDRLSSR